MVEALPEPLMMSLARIGRMSRCLRTARVLQRYLDGELDDPTTIARVHAHLEECRRCGLNAALGARAMAAAPSDPDEEFLGTFSIQQHLLKRVHGIVRFA
ncbi:MAG: zf-HC2 domain-containing protein [Actinomycetota bacterium]|nr:zf-HC2 domain-containing protein [Actinomycetota bacterium]